MDRLYKAFKALVDGLTKRVDYLAWYPGTIASQDEAGLLDVTVDDPRIVSVVGVPIRYGIPGVTAKVKTGGRVMIGFDSGNPDKPIATVWESATVEEINVTAETVRVQASEVLLKDPGGRSITAQGDSVTSGGLLTQICIGVPPTPPGAPPVPGSLLPVLTGIPLPVFWVTAGIPMTSLMGQVTGSFSPNKT